MKKQIPLIVVLVLIVVGAIAAGVAVWSGRLAVVVKDSTQEVSVHSRYVCGDDIVTEYNEAVSSATYEAYGTSLDAVFGRVDGLGGNEDDPTCLFVKYRYFMNKGQMDDVSSITTRIESLADAGEYPSIKLADIESLDGMTSRSVRGDSEVVETEGGE